MTLQDKKLIAVVVCIFTVIIALSLRHNNSQERQKQTTEVYQQNNLQKLEQLDKAAVKKLQETSILCNIPVIITTERYGDTSVRYVFDFQEEMDRSDYFDTARSMCNSLAADLYKRTHWVKVDVRYKGITQVEAHYSPLTNKVEVR